MPFIGPGMYSYALGAKAFAIFGYLYKVGIVAAA